MSYQRDFGTIFIDFSLKSVNKAEDWEYEARKPLDEIDFTKGDQPTLFGCQEGTCWT
jgi:hypothetical protein